MTNIFTGQPVFNPSAYADAFRPGSILRGLRLTKQHQALRDGVRLSSWECECIFCGQGHAVSETQLKSGYSDLCGCRPARTR